MKKLWAVVFCVMVAFFVIVSCGQNTPTGIIGASKVKLTETPTPTPDVNFTVYIHQEGTPVVDLSLSMLSAVSGDVLTAKTGADGKAGFKVHEGGQWTLNVNTFDGFKQQNFQVDPLSNTFFAMNYGIPSLDLELVSGSESIPIWPTTLVYKVTYHTKFEREGSILLTVPNGIVCDYSVPNIVVNESDFVTCNLNIPKSYEGYNVVGTVDGLAGITENKYINLQAICLRLGVTNTASNKRVLEKNWFFMPEVDLSYMQVYDYLDNSGKVSYYAGISNVYERTFCPGYTSSGVLCEAIDAANVGSDGTKPVIEAGLTMPSFTGFGTFKALIKVPTDADFNLGNLRDDNNGRVTVRFYDGLYLDVNRTFVAAGGWTMKCFHWSYTSSSEIDRLNPTCNDDVYDYMTVMQLIPHFAWDTAKLSDVYRKKTARVSQQ